MRDKQFKGEISSHSFIQKIWGLARSGVDKLKRTWFDSFNPKFTFFLWYILFNHAANLFSRALPTKTIHSINNMMHAFQLKLGYIIHLLLPLCTISCIFLQICYACYFDFISVQYSFCVLFSILFHSLTLFNVHLFLKSNSKSVQKINKTLQEKSKMLVDKRKSRCILLSATLSLLWDNSMVFLDCSIKRFPQGLCVCVRVHASMWIEHNSHRHSTPVACRQYNFWPQYSPNGLCNLRPVEINSTI